MQLVARGVDDIFLTVDPHITFFKSVYRRHTNFSKTEYNLRFTNKIDFGVKSDMKIQKYGDLLYKLYLVINLPFVNFTYQNYTVKQVQDLLINLNIDWTTTKNPDDYIDQTDYDNIKILINQEIFTLKHDNLISTNMIDNITNLTSLINPNIWISNNPKGTSDLYYDDVVTEYFTYNQYQIEYEFINANKLDKINPRLLYNSDNTKDILFLDYKNYALGVSIFDQTSFNDENIFFIYNTDNADYYIEGHVEYIKSFTIFQAGISRQYLNNTLLYDYLDSYKIFNSYLLKYNTEINSEFDIIRTKDTIINTIIYDLQNNILELEAIYNSLQNNAQFIFYRIMNKKTGGYDIYGSWTNMSTANNINPIIQDQYTSKFNITPIAGAPSDIYIPIQDYTNIKVEDFHNSNTIIFNSNLYNSYLDDVNLTVRLDIINSGLYADVIKSQNNGAIPSNFGNILFLNYTPIFSNRDIPTVINLVLKNLLDTHPEHAQEIQNIINILDPLLTTTQTDINNKLIPVIINTTYDFLIINNLNIFRSILGPSGDVLYPAIIRQGEFLTFNNIDYVPPEYVVVRYLDLINSISAPYYQVIRPILVSVINLFGLSPEKIPDYTTYYDNNYNSNPLLKINTKPPLGTLNASPTIYIYSDILNSIWINILKSFVNNYNNLYTNNILNSTVYTDEFGVEIDSYLVHITDQILNNPSNYYYDSSKTYFQNKLPINNGEIGKYLNRRLKILQDQLKQYDNNYGILLVQDIVLQGDIYYFDYYQHILDTLINILEYSKDPNGNLIYYHQPHNQTIADPVYRSKIKHTGLIGILDIIKETNDYFELLITSITNPFNIHTDRHKYELWNKLWLPIKQFDTEEERLKYQKLFDNLTTKYLFNIKTDLDLYYNSLNHDTDVYNFMLDIIIDITPLYDKKLVIDPSIIITTENIINLFQTNINTNTKTIDKLNSVDQSIKVNLTKSGQPSNFAWIEYIGCYIIKKINLYIGDQLINSHTGEYIFLYYNLNRRRQKNRGLLDLIGQNPVLTEYNNKPKPEYQIILPLVFFNCNNPGVAIPLIALQHTDIRIHIELNDLDSMCVTDYRKDIHISDCYIIGEYIYLEEEERRNFATNKHEYLIETLQYNGDLIINKNSLYDNDELNIKFYFKNLVKELIWMVQDMNNVRNKKYYDYTYNNKNPADKIKIKFMSRDREPYKDSIYYNYIMPYERHTSNPILGVNNYSFSLFTDNFMQPSGSANMSRIDDAGLGIIFNKDVINAIYKGGEFRCPVYAVSYNILRVMSGLSGLAFNYV